MQQRGAAAAVQDVPVRERGRPPADSLRNYLLQVSHSLPQPAQPRNPRKISYFIGSRGYFILDLRPGILQIGSVERGGPNTNTTMCPLIYTRYTLYCPIRIPSEVYLTVPDIYILREVTSLPSSAPAGGLTLAPCPLGAWPRPMEEQS